MKEYEFALRFRLPDPETDPESLLGVLLAAGCDDATVGIGKKGRIALDFTRSAASARDAMESAIRDVQHAIPGTTLIEAEPDYVGISDIAECIGVSRQYVLRMITENWHLFPAPVHEGSSALYHLADVLAWFERERHRPAEPLLVEVAHVAKRLNVVREAKALQIAI
jgi:predicted DNA-binding transcriptional regulator AlpA